MCQAFKPFLTTHDPHSKLVVGKNYFPFFLEIRKLRLRDRLGNVSKFLELARKEITAELCFP